MSIFDPIYRLRVEWRGKISHLLSTVPLRHFQIKNPNFPHSTRTFRPRWSIGLDRWSARPTNVILVIPMCPGGISLICALRLKYGAEMSKMKWILIKSTKAFRKSYKCTKIVCSWKEKQNNRKLIIVQRRLYLHHGTARARFTSSLGSILKVWNYLFY